MPALLAAIAFVLIWSSGFVVARAVIADADPQAFLLVRLALVALLMAGWAAAARDRWPRGRQLALHLVAGALLPGFYLCGGWWAIADGMPAGIMSLLGGLQPLMIAILAAALLGERLTARSWIGLAIGTLGVAFVLEPAIGNGVGGVTPLAAAVGIVAVIGMAAAAMIQRARLAADALAPGVALQNMSGTAVAVVAWLLIGERRWDGTPLLWGSLAWSVLGLSAAALTLLAWMLRHQGAARVSLLLLLVPPLAAVEAWALFGERLSAIQVAGFALALGGVLLARTAPPPDVEPA